MLVNDRMWRPKIEKKNIDHHMLILIFTLNQIQSFYLHLFSNGMLLAHGNPSLHYFNHDPKSTQRC
jgi:hypothetical protein